MSHRRYRRVPAWHASGTYAPRCRGDLTAAAPSHGSRPPRPIPIRDPVGGERASCPVTVSPTAASDRAQACAVIAAPQRDEREGTPPGPPKGGFHRPAGAAPTAPRTPRPRRHPAGQTDAGEVAGRRGAPHPLRPAAPCASGRTANPAVPTALHGERGPSGLAVTEARASVADRPEGREIHILWSVEPPAAEIRHNIL